MGHGATNDAAARPAESLGQQHLRQVLPYNTYTSSFDIAVPSGGKWEIAYDIWVQNSSKTQVESMLWVNYTKGSVFPAGSLGKSGVSTGGHTWDV